MSGVVTTLRLIIAFTRSLDAISSTLDCETDRLRKLISSMRSHFPREYRSGRLISLQKSEWAFLLFLVKELLRLLRLAYIIVACLRIWRSHTG